MPWAFVLMAGRKLNVADFRKNYWKKIAILCRYGHVSLSDAMSMPLSDTRYFTEEVDRLISEENTFSKD